MFRDFLAKGLLRALAVFGLLALTTLSGNGLVTAAPAFERTSGYAPTARTTVDLRLESATMRPGQTMTAFVSVSSSSGTPQGTVTFKVSGRAPESVALVAGEASWTLPSDLAAGRTYKVTARYNGTGVWRTASDVAYVTVVSGEVAGTSAVASGGGSGDTVTAASAGDAAGLPGVGQDASTQIAMFAGIGLVAGGLFSLALYRRRVTN